MANGSTNHRVEHLYPQIWMLMAEEMSLPIFHIWDVDTGEGCFPLEDMISGTLLAMALSNCIIITIEESSRITLSSRMLIGR